jgi:hypothetical protein
MADETALANLKAEVTRLRQCRRHLPRAGQRMGAKRKAAILEALACGQISRETALANYGLSDEELDRWAELAELGGVTALRTTRVQRYRGK